MKNQSIRSAVKTRTQILNPKNGLYTKGNKDKGQFIGANTTGRKTKRVMLENNKI